MELLLNGGFESPALADGTYTAAPAPGWTGGAYTDNPSAGGTMAGLGFVWPQAAEGSQYRDIANYAAYAMSQPFTLATAGDVQLSWQDNTALAIIPGYQTAPYRVTISTSGGATVYSADFDSWRASGAWQARTATVNLAAGTYTLTFASQNLPNHTDTLIDAVSVQGPAP